MDALLFRHSIPRYLASRLVHGLAPGLWTPQLAPIAPVSGGPSETPPVPGWCRVKVRLSGICGTDLRLLVGGGSLALEPEATYPFIPGHEVVGSIENDPEGELQPGQRVALWPALGCRARGVEPLCPRCIDGWDALCLNRDDSWPGRGVAIGFNRLTRGGWGQWLWAHRSQLWPLSTALSDEDAVLLDPAATALAALLRTETPETHRTLVVGGGTIGLLVALLHRALARPGECVLVVRHAFQEQLALEFGLAVIRIRGEREFRDWASTEGIGSRRVMGYGHVFDGVFDRVIDAAGSDTSFRWALHAVRAGGRLVLVSAPARLRLDPTPLWYREIQVHGINVYGPVPWEGEQAHPYAVLLEVLARGDLDWRRLVTHVVPLSDWVVGVSKALRRGGEPAIKVAFRP